MVRVEVHVVQVLPGSLGKVRVGKLDEQIMPASATFALDDVRALKPLGHAAEVLHLPPARIVGETRHH